MKQNSGGLKKTQKHWMLALLSAMMISLVVAEPVFAACTTVLYETFPGGSWDKFRNIANASIVYRNGKYWLRVQTPSYSAAETVSGYSYSGGRIVFEFDWDYTAYNVGQGEGFAVYIVDKQNPDQWDNEAGFVVEFNTAGGTLDMYTQFWGGIRYDSRITGVSRPNHFKVRIDPSYGGGTAFFYVGGVLKATLRAPFFGSTIWVFTSYTNIGAASGLRESMTCRTAS